MKEKLLNLVGMAVGVFLLIKIIDQSYKNGYNDAIREENSESDDYDYEPDETE